MLNFIGGAVIIAYVLFVAHNILKDVYGPSE